MTQIRTNIDIEGNESTLRLVGEGMQSVLGALEVMIPSEVTFENLSLKKISLFEAQKIVYSHMSSVVCGVFRYFGKASGYILVSIGEEDLERFLGLLKPNFRFRPDYEDEHVRSAIAEVSNILGSSFLSVVANKADIKIDQSVPEFYCDYAGSIINAIMAKQNKYSKWMYVIEGGFRFDDQPIQLEFMNIPASRERSIFEIAVEEED